MQKTRRRKHTLPTFNLSEEQACTLEKVLTVDYMSSEEEVEDSIDRITRPLTWGVNETDHLEAAVINKQYYDNTTDSQKKKMLRTKRGEPSSRDSPYHAPRWACQ